MYAASDGRRAARADDSAAHGRSGRGRDRAAGENGADPGENATRRASSEDRARSGPQRNPSPPDFRNAYRHHKRQIPIYADYWDAVDDDGSADDAGDGDFGYAGGDGDSEDGAPVRLCDGNRRVVGYYSSWNPNEMSDGMMEMLTHVIYSFLIPQADGTVDFDSPAALDRLRRLMELRKSHPQVKIMFAVGGGASSQHFGTITSSADLRKTFADSIVRLTDDNGLS